MRLAGLLALGLPLLGLAASCGDEDPLPPVVLRLRVPAGAPVAWVRLQTGREPWERPWYRLHGPDGPLLPCGLEPPPAIVAALRPGDTLELRWDGAAAPPGGSCAAPIQARGLALLATVCWADASSNRDGLAGLGGVLRCDTVPLSSTQPVEVAAAAPAATVRLRNATGEDLALKAVSAEGHAPGWIVPEDAAVAFSPTCGVPICGDPLPLRCGERVSAPLYAAELVTWTWGGVLWSLRPEGCQAPSLVTEAALPLQVCWGERCEAATLTLPASAPLDVTAVR